MHAYSADNADKFEWKVQNLIDVAETVGSIASAIAPIDGLTTCSAVFDLFASDTDLVCLAITEGDRPTGLINRAEITMLWATQFGRSLFAQKAITSIMDKTPLIVPAHLHIDAVKSLIVTEKPSALLRGFIVIANEQYYGIGTALSLVQLSVTLATQRNRELEAAKQAAEQASLTKSRFLATMSHELRTPLNAIIGFSDMIMSQSLGADAHDRYREYAGDINASGRLLLDLISDILDLSKAEAGRLDLYEEEVDLAKAATSCLRLIKAHQPLQLDIRCDIPANLPFLWGDERKIKQIMMNLLSNAVKFTPESGHITVSIKHKASGSLSITVADTGIGIADKDLVKVVQPFTQIDNSFTRKYAGTGLGLTLVKQLVELHDGHLVIESQLGLGTAVTVRFPPSRVRPRNAAMLEAINDRGVPHLTASLGAVAERS